MAAGDQRTLSAWGHPFFYWNPRGEGALSARLDWGVELTLGLAVLTEEGRVDDEAVYDTLELAWKLEGLRKVVKDELREDVEAVVVLQQKDLWPGLALVSRSLQSSQYIVQRQT